MNEKELELLERFQIGNRLGVGGIGAVYEAFDSKTQERVALKTLLDFSKKDIKRFENEFFSLKDLHHPNLVLLKEFFKVKSQSFFSMELVEGIDFLSYVQKRGEPGFDEAKLRHCLGQLVDGVSALHRHGKVHRDLKPSNILVTPEGRLAILDYGLVTDVVGGYQIDDISAMGTSAYMSPEQSIGNPVNAASDWYSVGIIMYQALAGSLPYKGTPAQIKLLRMEAGPEDVKDYNKNIPADLATLCMDLLRSNPNDRPRRHEIYSRLGRAYPGANHSAYDLRDAEFFVENIPYIGREKELRKLANLFAEPPGGHASQALILGEPGIGKTALAKEFVRRAKESNSALLVFFGKFSPNDGRRFQAFDSIISELADSLIDILNENRNTSVHFPETTKLTPSEAAAVSKLFPVLLVAREFFTISVQKRVLSNAHHVRTEALQGIRKLLTLVVNHRPLLIFLDDIQWAKADSLDLLRELSYAEGRVQPKFLMTMRVNSPSEPTIHDIFPDINELILKDMNDSEMWALADCFFQSYGRESLPEKHIFSFIKEANGHPLFLAELIRHYIEVGEKFFTYRLEDTILSRIRLLDEDTRQILELVSLSGCSLDFETLADAADKDAKHCAEIISDLVAKNLIRKSSSFQNEFIEPFHDRVHEVVTANIDDKTRARHHLKLSYSLKRMEKNIDRAIVVRHLEAAGCEEEAAVEATRAAHAASDSLAFGQAVELFQTALRLIPYNEPIRKQLLMHLGDALCNIGKCEEASRAYLDARQGSNVTTRFKLWRRAAEQLVLAGHLEEGIAELRLLLREIGERYIGNRLRALLSLLWTRTLLKLRWFFWKETAEDKIDPLKLARIDIYQVVAEVLSMVDNILGASYQARRLLAALRAGEIKRIGHALVFEASFLFSQGRVRATDKGRRFLNRAGLIAKQHCIESLEIQCSVSSGMLKYFEGYLREASILLTEAESRLKRHSDGSRFILNNTRFLRLRVLRIMGDFEQIKKDYDTYLREAKRQGDKYMETNLNYLSSSAWVISGNVDFEAKNLSGVDLTPPQNAYHLQDWYATVARAEIALYRGTVHTHFLFFLNDFKALCKSLLLRMGIYRADYWWLKGRLLLSMMKHVGTGTRNDFIKETHRLAKKLSPRKTGFLPSELWSSLLQAALASQKRQKEKSIAILQSAIVRADKFDFYQISACSRRRLGQILGGKSGADLIAEGEIWMKKNEISDFDSVTEMFLPGFRLQ